MSDDQFDNNLPGKDPDVKGGWHQPTTASLWQKPTVEEEPVLAGWQTMPAFPDDMSEAPQEQGGWHLPSPEDTLLKPDDQITRGQPVIADAPVVEPSSPGILSPEDMIAQILNVQQQASVGAPEDIVQDYAKPKETEVVEEPEEEEIEEIDEEEIEDEVEDLLDSLDELDDDEEDPFSMTERTALMDLADDEIVDPATGEDDDRAMFERVVRATDEIPQLTQEQIDGVQTPTPPDSDVSADSAADYARKMLEQLEQEESGSSLGNLFAGTAELEERADTSDPSGQAQSYAERMLQELGDDGGNISSDTGSSGTYGTQPLNLGGEPTTPYIDPGTREVANRFRNMQNQVATLNRIYQDGGMNYDEYQRQLYENMVQDGNGIWWMIGANSDKWYRHDPSTNSWEEDFPEPLQELNQYEQRARGGSMQQSAPQTYDLPSIDGEFTQGSAPQQVGDTLYDNFGVPVGRVQPQSDTQYTQVSPSAYANEIADQQSTIASDPGSGYDPTVLSPSVADAASQQTVPMQSYAGYEGIAGPLDSSEPGEYTFDEPAPTVKDIRDRERQTFMRVIVFAVVAVIALGLVVTILGAMGIALWYSNTVQPYRTGIVALADYNPPFQTARIYDANGDLIVELNSQETGARTAVPLEDISPFMIHAIISQENERFYEDPGFDPIAIVRAFFQNIVGGEIESGASTITQQIARNLVLQDTDVTSERKINEILVAMEIANTYDKNFILELYLNEVFFGNQSYGVEAASQFYFEHGADELNYAESALLASIVPSPALNDPVVNRPTAIIGMRDTMRKMIQVNCLQFQHGDWLARGPFCIGEGVFTEFEGDSVRLLTLRNGEINGGLAALQIAQVETGDYEPRNVRLKYPHFVNFVQAQVEAQFGTNALFQRGFNIYTTLVPSVQDTAEEALSTQVDNLVDSGVNTGSVMVTDPNTGAIRAMVGSHDFTDAEAGQVNNALTLQQPGSAIKPVVYTAALVGNGNQYLTPASILWDVPVSYNIAGSLYTPVNFDRRFHGATPMRFALGNSYNVAAVKAYAFIGNQRFLETAQAMGLQFAENASFNLPSALGANDVRLIDMMKAYGTLANGGKNVELYAIERISETVDGGQVEVPMPPRPEPVQAISPQVAYLMQNVLSDDNARAEQFGRNSNLTLARLGLNSLNRIAAKTGTSNDARDLWTMGFTQNVVVGVWLGTFDNAPTFGVTGFTAAAPVWNVTLEAALRGRTPPEYQNPGGVIAQEFCRTTGTQLYDGCPERTTGLFIQDKFPPPPDQGFVQTIAIDSWTGLRANEFCDDFIITDTFANINDPSAVEWLNNTAEGRSYAQVVGLPIPLRQAPAEACAQGMTLPNVEITFPGNNQTIQEEVTIAGVVSAPNFARYELAYSTAGQPDTWIPIGSPVNQQQPNRGQPLGTWDTTQVANGNYTIRLLATSASGGTITRTVPVSVQNILPTATPTQIPLPTVDTSGSSLTGSGLTASTAIPFESLNPTATPGS